MTPQEKAKELVDKFIPHTRVFHEILGWEDYFDSAKQCALIAIDELMKWDDGYGGMSGYLIEVKQEIEKL